MYRLQDGRIGYTETLYTVQNGGIGHFVTSDNFYTRQCNDFSS